MNVSFVASAMLAICASAGGQGSAPVGLAIPWEERLPHDDFTAIHDAVILAVHNCDVPANNRALCAPRCKAEQFTAASNCRKGTTHPTAHVGSRYVI